MRTLVVFCLSLSTALGAFASLSARGDDGRSHASALPFQWQTENLEGLACRVYWNSGTPWEYTCETEEACTRFDITKCTPVGLTRGTAAIDEECRRDAAYELGDTCAPAPQWAKWGPPKGSLCVAKPGTPRSFCSHSCDGYQSSCADLGPEWGCDAFVGVCRKNAPR